MNEKYNSLYDLDKIITIKSKTVYQSDNFKNK